MRQLVNLRGQANLRCPDHGAAVQVDTAVPFLLLDDTCHFLTGSTHLLFFLEKNQPTPHVMV